MTQTAWLPSFAMESTLYHAWCSMGAHESGHTCRGFGHEIASSDARHEQAFTAGIRQAGHLLCDRKTRGRGYHEDNGRHRAAPYRLVRPTSRFGPALRPE